LTRRGGGFYILFLIIFMMLIAGSSVVLFTWLNTWMKASDKSNFYYFCMFIAFLCANSITLFLHCFFEYNSSFFVKLHRAMVLNLLTAPMSYF
jgi:hypothetical protein